MINREIIASVIENKPLNKVYHSLVLAFQSADFSCAPGQFVMQKVASGFDPLLRRPFSIWDWRNKGKQHKLHLFYKVVGRGTQAMLELKQGQAVSLGAPLGSSFKPDPKRRRKVLLSGGVGLPPIDFLINSSLLKNRDVTVDLFHGEQSAKQHLPLAWETGFDHARVHRATDDGSGHFHGNVMQLFDSWLKDKQKDRKFDLKHCEIFACGPNAMLRGVQEFALKHKLPAQISVENQMGCGRGVCLGCVLKNRNATADADRWLRVCCEGPVFSAQEVELP